ncbi:hypothetical protein NEOLEDRAFT_1152536 [Neolentinus lepideus HHB14362 ss-1]|uniref:Uncharacterized protein n=1 Tax=Neolentinus lepideus HHB14362 ss-1 TaxID=1314782 RepID=A0A165MNR9_9AGAM|nr:hypothetical protein NEOLEDRAFT_1152536 [Neolentinus lepideus HHB14362 ss-1]
MSARLRGKTRTTGQGKQSYRGSTHSILESGPSLILSFTVAAGHHPRLSFRALSPEQHISEIRSPAYGVEQATLTDVPCSSGGITVPLTFGGNLIASLAFGGHLIATHGKFDLRLSTTNLSSRHSRFAVPIIIMCSTGMEYTTMRGVRDGVFGGGVPRSQRPFDVHLR